VDLLHEEDRIQAHQELALLVRQGSFGQYGYAREPLEKTRLQVADVRVESKGRGAQGEAQTEGWLSRFFLSFNPF
jgi:hypothetical protein